MEDTLEKAYSEVYKILSFMESKYIEKIPKKMIETFKNRKESNYDPKIDWRIPLNEQGLQRRTLAILAMININYWCEDKIKKQELIKTYVENDKKKEKELGEKYNLDRIFKEKKNVNNNKEAIEQLELIKYKESNIFAKILNKIKNFFKIK